MPNRKVLVVGDPSLPLAGGAPVLALRFEVRTARTPEEAFRRIASEGPFAVALAGGRHAPSEAEFLREVGARCPDTVRILVSADPDPLPGGEAVHAGGIFCALRAPLAPELLLDTLEQAVRRFQRVEGERLLTEQLQFSRESLLDFAETLERRLSDERARLRELEHFVLELGRCRSLDDIAALAAATSAVVLGARPIVVTLSAAGEDEIVRACGEAGEASEHEEPIPCADGELGSLAIGAHRAGQALTKEELGLVRSIAAQTGIAVAGELRRRARDLAHHGTILALARLAESRDDETGKHIERVSAYCRLIAEGMRDDGLYRDTITPAFLRDLVLSAPLHDIGKVGIPDAILRKPGPLTPEEWEIMRRHTVIGAETLKHVLDKSGEQSFLRMGHEIAWCHHERWDGSGYPRGLRGTEIPLAARIMSLADCYDALTRRRPYKEPWGHEEALAYVRDQHGKQFDPGVVDSFVARAARADEIRGRLLDHDEDVEAAA